MTTIEALARAAALLTLAAEYTREATHATVERDDAREMEAHAEVCLTLAREIRGALPDGLSSVNEDMKRALAPIMYGAEAGGYTENPFYKAIKRGTL